jgi:hypothetical protein
MKRGQSSLISQSLPCNGFEPSRRPKEDRILTIGRTGTRLFLRSFLAFQLLLPQTEPIQGFVPVQKHNPSAKSARHLYVNIAKCSEIGSKKSVEKVDQKTRSKKSIKKFGRNVGRNSPSKTSVEEFGRKSRSKKRVQKFGRKVQSKNPAENVARKSRSKTSIEKLGRKRRSQRSLERFGPKSQSRKSVAKFGRRSWSKSRSKTSIENIGRHMCRQIFQSGEIQEAKYSSRFISTSLLMVYSLSFYPGLC